MISGEKSTVIAPQHQTIFLPIFLIFSHIFGFQKLYYCICGYEHLWLFLMFRFLYLLEVLTYNICPIWQDHCYFVMYFIFTNPPFFPSGVLILRMLGLWVLSHRTLEVWFKILFCHGCSWFLGWSSLLTIFKFTYVILLSSPFFHKPIQHFKIFRYFVL